MTYKVNMPVTTFPKPCACHDSQSQHACDHFPQAMCLSWLANMPVTTFPIFAELPTLQLWAGRPRRHQPVPDCCWLWSDHPQAVSAKPATQHSLHSELQCWLWWLIGKLWTEGKYHAVLFAGCFFGAPCGRISTCNSSDCFCEPAHLCCLVPSSRALFLCPFLVPFSPALFPLPASHI